VSGPLPVLADADPTNVPQTIQQAMECKFAHFWAEAIIDEWMSLLANNTWSLVQKQPWMKVIPCKWVFVIKTDEKGQPCRFKARLVAGGHRQTEGIDYEETFAPVSRASTLRIMLGVAASKGWKVHQLDVKTAFLHGEVGVDVYMKQPSGFVDGVDHVCHLQKCLYGLKQAPREWYRVLKNALQQLGFQPVAADSSFWVCETNGIVVYLSSVVDDMLVVSPSEDVTLSIVRRILDMFPGKHEGRAKYYNGMRITWLDSTQEVLLTQSAHVQKLADKFSAVADVTIPRTLPAKPGIRLCNSGSSMTVKSPLLNTDEFHYRALIGGLNYLSNGTRPDITFIVNQLSKYANAPTVEHWEIALDVLRYLNHTQTWGIKLGGAGCWTQVTFKHKHYDPVDPPAVAYADANHGTGLDNKKSVSGMLIQVMRGPVSWGSRTQTLTSMSTTESEYRALSECSKEALWIAKLLELFQIPSKPFLICGDSQGAIGAIKNYRYTKHTKHVEIHHDFMKDRYQRGDLDFVFVPGAENIADIFTKALPRPQFEKLRRMLSMACLQE
jgi:hypothetical protein